MVHRHNLCAPIEFLQAATSIPAKKYLYLVHDENVRVEHVLLVMRWQATVSILVKVLVRRSKTQRSSFLHRKMFNFNSSIIVWFSIEIVEKSKRIEFRHVRYHFLAQDYRDTERKAFSLIWDGNKVSFVMLNFGRWIEKSIVEFWRGWTNFVEQSLQMMVGLVCLCFIRRFWMWSRFWTTSSISFVKFLDNFLQLRSRKFWP